MDANKYGYTYDAATNTFIPTHRYLTMKAKLREAAHALMEGTAIYDITGTTTLTEEKGNEQRN